MSSVGILAYGSLIEDLGKEIEPLIRERRENIETPFSIEFARSSSTRDGAPTLVPVENGGSPVLATVLLLEAGVSFLGFGDPSTMTWGQILENNFGSMNTVWWAELFPGIAVLITVFGFNLLGDGLSDALNPRLRD